MSYIGTVEIFFDKYDDFAARIMADEVPQGS